MITERVKVKKEIRLDRFMKWAGAVSTGGQAKIIIKEGLVKVNGRVENRRGRILRDGDRVKVGEDDFLVVCCEGCLTLVPEKPGTDQFPELRPSNN
jgi:ribosome-associated protein